MGLTSHTIPIQYMTLNSNNNKLLCCAKLMFSLNRFRFSKGEDFDILVHKLDPEIKRSGCNIDQQTNTKINKS